MNLLKNQILILSCVQNFNKSVIYIFTQIVNTIFEIFFKHAFKHLSLEFLYSKLYSLALNVNILLKLLR